MHQDYKKKNDKIGVQISGYHSVKFAFIIKWILWPSPVYLGYFMALVSKLSL